MGLASGPAHLFLNHINISIFAGSNDDSSASVDYVLPRVSNKDDDDAHLTAPFSLEEFREVISQMHLDKVPRLIWPQSCFLLEIFVSYWTIHFSGFISWLQASSFPSSLNMTNIVGHQQEVCPNVMRFLIGYYA